MVQANDPSVLGSSIETDEITDNAVTLAKLADGTANKVLGFDSGGVAAEITALNTLLGDGSDGDVTISSNTDLGSANTKNYSSLTIDAGVSLTGDSPLHIHVANTLTFGDGTSTIHADGKGGAGGVSEGNGTDADWFGDSKALTRGKGTNSNYVGGGSGGFAGAGGDGGAHSSSAGAAVSGISNTILLFAGTFNGAGGGCGCWDGGTSPNSGGAGGGAVVVYAKAVSGTGIISANGGVGTTSSGGNGGGGGGGSGGLAVLFCLGAIPGVTVRAHGGNGGSDATLSRGGGGGGGGLVIVVSPISTAATTTATAGTGPGSGVDGTVGITLNGVL